MIPRALIFFILFNVFSTAVSAVEMINMQFNMIEIELVNEKNSHLDCESMKDTSCIKHDQDNCCSTVHCLSSSFIVDNIGHFLFVSKEKNQFKFSDSYFYHIIYPVVTPPPLA